MVWNINNSQANQSKILCLFINYSVKKPWINCVDSLEWCLGIILCLFVNYSVKKPWINCVLMLWSNVMELAEWVLENKHKTYVGGLETIRHIIWLVVSCQFKLSSRHAINLPKNLFAYFEIYVGCHTKILYGNQRWLPLRCLIQQRALKILSLGL